MRLDCILFGYRQISFGKEEVAAAATALLKAGLAATFSHSGQIDVPLHRLRRYEKALGGISYSVSEIKGLASLAVRNAKRYGAFAAIAILAVLFIFTSGRVLDVRVEGGSPYAEARILEGLAEAGLSTGAAWRDIDLDKIELSALESVPGLSWINVNRRGGVAYVRVREKTDVPKEEELSGFCNVVAVEDCVITEITVIRGIALVKPGDTVKKGDLLISGVIPEQLGGGFVRAEGYVIGRVSRTVSVSVPREECKKRVSAEIPVRSDLNILGFSLNIFKKSGNSDKSYVIIEDKKNFSVRGRYKLPVELIRAYALEYEEYKVSYTDTELPLIASERLSSKRALEISGAELLSIRTDGAFTEDGYTMSSEMLILTSVAEEKFFG